MGKKPKYKKSSESAPAATTSTAVDTPTQQGDDLPKAPYQVSKQSELSQPKDFDAWYLRNVTAEFADDLDTVRQAPDFTDQSLPMLVEALRQGTELYSDVEKRKVMGG